MSDTDIKAKLKKFFNPFLSHPVCLSNAILLALTTGFEQAWEDLIFKCPELPSTVTGFWSNKCYSVVFVLAPALALWILGTLGSNLAWRMCQGLRSRGKFCGGKHDCGCFNVLVIVLRNLVVPLTWVFVALMDGDFYACFKYLPSCVEDPIPGPVSTLGSIPWTAGTDLHSPESTSGLVDGVNCTKNSTVWKYEKRVESQLIGWIVLVTCLFFGSCFVFCGRCLSRRTYFPHLYSQKLREGERKLIEERLTMKAEVDGERNVSALMKQFISKKAPLSASDWESICREYTEQECEPRNTSEQVLLPSPLSEFLNKHPKILENFEKGLEDTDSVQSELNLVNPTTNP